MLIKDRAELILGETLINLRSPSKSEEMDKRFKKLLMEADELNRDFRFHDTDIVRWCRKFMKMGEPGNKLPVQELADLRAITEYKGTVALWARQQKKTTNIVLAAAYETISLKKDVLIIVATDLLKSLMMRRFDFNIYPELKDVVVKSFCSGGCRIELQNGANIWIHSARTLKEGLECVRQADSIYVDDLDIMTDSEQERIIELVGEKQGFRFFSTPVIRMENGKQVFTPFQELIESGASKNGNIKGFHTIHRMASENILDSYMMAHMSRETIMTELEANYHLADASILLGD